MEHKYIKSKAAVIVNELVWITLISSSSAPASFIKARSISNLTSSTTKVVWGDIIKVKDTIVTLDYFQGTIVPIVQETSIRHDVKDKMECYGWTNPDSGPTFYETGNCTMYSKRIVGPLIREMIGDTIKIYSLTVFSCNGSNFLGNRGDRRVRDSISVIIK